MKKNFLLILFLVTAFIQVKATDWFPLDAKWYYGINECCVPPSQGYSYNEVVKDTIIDLKICKVIYYSEYSSIGSISNDRYIMHQEGDKIYHYSNGNFLLTYDFSKGAGDSVLFVTPKTNFKCDSFLFRVDSVNINQGLKVQYGKVYSICDQKQLLALSNAREIVYEKAGNIGFLNECYFSCTDPNSYYLRCYSDSLININSGNCDFITSVQEKINNNLSIKIFPNPAIEKIIIELKDSKKYKTTKLELYDIKGKQIKSIENIHLQNAELDIADCSNGIYYLKILIDDEFLTKQIIINH